MSQKIDVPGQGVIEFPSDMTDDAIKDVIHRKFYSGTTKTETAQVQPAAQPQTSTSSLAGVAPESDAGALSLEPQAMPGAERLQGIDTGPQLSAYKPHAGGGVPLMTERQRDLDKIKADAGKSSMSNEDFIRENPELQMKYGFISKMPMQRVNAKDLSEATGMGKTAAGVVAGTQNAVADLADFMTSAPGVMTLMTGGIAGAAALPTVELIGGVETSVASPNLAIAKAITKSTAQGFAADMARNMPDQFNAVSEAIKRGDTAEATRGVLGMAASIGIIAGAAHTTLAAKPVIETKAPVEQLKEAAIQAAPVAPMTAAAVADQVGGKVEIPKESQLTATLTDASIKDETRNKNELQAGTQNEPISPQKTKIGLEDTKTEPKLETPNVGQENVPGVGSEAGAYMAPKVPRSSPEGIQGKPNLLAGENAGGEEIRTPTPNVASLETPAAVQRTGSPQERQRTGQQIGESGTGEQGSSQPTSPGEASGKVESERLKAEAEKSHPTLPGTEPPKGIAASVRNKWTTATADEPLGSEAGFFTLAPVKEMYDRAAPHVKSVVDFIMEVGKDASRATKLGDKDKAKLNWSAKLQRSFGEAAAAQKEIRSKVKNPIRRDGITNWIQAGGDAAVLAQRRAATDTWRDPTTGNPHPQRNKLLAGYDAALNLTTAEISVANDVKQAYDALLNRGMSYDVIKSFKDNYVTQIWNRVHQPSGSGSLSLKDKFRFAKASTFPTFFDGEQAGYVPKTKDISQLLPVYLHEMNSVIANRQMVAEMSNGKSSDGRPLLVARGVGVPVDGPSGKATLIMPDVPKGKDTSDYKVLENQPALHDWRWASKDTDGNPIYLKGDLALHPELYKDLKNVLGKSAIREWYNSRTTATAQIPKLLVKGLDMANSETKRTMLGFLAPFHQVQEGTHAVGHRVNPFFSIPKIDLVNDAGQMDAAKHGLMLLPDRASQGQFMEGFRTSGLVSKMPLGIGKVADFYSNYLFHEYIPGIKYKTYADILTRSKNLYASDVAAGKITDADVKHLSATQANAAFGHLNYTDLSRNPTIQHFMQLGLLAPDFLEARARFAGQSIKGATGLKVGREQLLALATLAIGQAAMSYLSARLTGGEWDKNKPFEFHRGNRSYTIRSVPEDVHRLMTDTRAFAYARLAPITGRGAIQYVSGTDWRGQKVSAMKTTKELATAPMPLTLRGLFGVGNSPVSGWEQLASAVGFKIGRYSERQNVSQMAKDWAKSSSDSKVKSEFVRRESESFGDSIYKPLRDALSKGSDIKSEIQSLLDKEPDAANRAKRLTSLLNTFNPNSSNGVKPFATHNREYERAFIKTLDAEGKKKYSAAVQEQARDYLAVKQAVSEIRAKANR